MWRVLRGLIVLAVVVAAIVVGGAYALPGRATFERHTVIAAPAEKIFPLIGELANYPKWLPWMDRDPAMTYATDAASGKMTWNSAVPSIGEGTAEIGEVKLGESVALRVTGSRWQEAEMRLRLAAVEGGTGVTWTLSYPTSGIINRWREFLRLEDTTSPDLVAGLAKLKQLAEAPEGATP